MYETLDMQHPAMKAAVAQFPETFGLRAYPGARFRVWPRSSYMRGETPILYTQRLTNGEWVDFAKGTAEELRAQVRT